MNFASEVVHAGDRKRQNGHPVPSTTPIHLGTTYFYDSANILDRVLGHEEEGYCYARYTSPTNAALEELTTTLERGAGSLATSSGMAALQIAFQAALVDRPHRILASSSQHPNNCRISTKCGCRSRRRQHVCHAHADASARVGCSHRGPQCHQVFGRAWRRPGRSGD